MASCCGHNVAPPTIMVQGAGDHVREMLCSIMSRTRDS